MRFGREDAKSGMQRRAVQGAKTQRRAVQKARISESVRQRSETSSSASGAECRNKQKRPPEERDKAGS